MKTNPRVPFLALALPVCLLLGAVNTAHAAGTPWSDPATWPNTGIGRINPDGSEGSCTACHSSVGMAPAAEVVDATVVTAEGGPAIRWRNVERASGDTLNTATIRRLRPLLRSRERPCGPSTSPWNNSCGLAQ